jgi:GT2 family glycosyltransferase
VAGQADEVVLVDNGSLESAASQIGRAAGVRVRRLSKNLGFAAGVNAGVARATGDIVALLNDDALADPGWLASAEAALADPAVAAMAPKLLLDGTFAEVAFPDAPHFGPGDGRALGRRLQAVVVGGIDVLPAVVGGIHRLEEGLVEGKPARWRWTNGSDPIYVPLPGDASPDDVRVDDEPVDVSWTGNVINNAGSYISTEGYGGDFGFETPDDGRFDAPAERFAATGAAMVARAETFRRLGGMAASFFAYYEDTDWCWRARLAGMKILYEPRGVVRHVRSATSGGTHDPLVRLLAGRNRILCLARNAPVTFAFSQLEKAWQGKAVPGLRRSLVRRVPPELARRRHLARHWVHSPAEVLGRWAGADNQWGLASQAVFTE